MTSITWAGPRYVQELGTFSGSQNRTQRGCDRHQSRSAAVPTATVATSRDEPVSAVEMLRLLVVNRAANGPSVFTTPAKGN